MRRGLQELFEAITANMRGDWHEWSKVGSSENGGLIFVIFAIVLALYFFLPGHRSKR